MNIFDELGGISPKTEGGLARQPKEKQQDEFQAVHLQTQHGFQQRVGAGPKKEEVPSGWTRFIKLAYYVQYFQVSENQVVQRIKYSFLTPYQVEFVEMTKSNPDFYGPFWILTTIILLLGFVGNFSNYLLSMFSSGEVWEKYFFKLQYLREAITLIYTFGFGVPVALFFILKVKGEKVELQLPNLVCLYGYALFSFIPAIVACILPIGFLQWLCILYAFASSSIFLKCSLQNHVSGFSPMIMASIICAIQFLLALCVKLIFLSLL